MKKKPIPNFFCFGAQKAGTTSLHNILKQHPDIYLPPCKEPQFFDVNERYEKGIDFFFTEFFDTYDGEQVVGNINPNLQLETRSIDRIVENFGIDLKAIFIMRDPVDRAYSHYLMSKRRGYEQLSFMDAVEAEKQRIKNPIKHEEYFLTQELGHYEKDHLGYIYRSKYLKTIKYLFKTFPANNIKIILFEDFISDTKKVINEILNFIGLSSSHQIVEYNLQSNPASSPKSSMIRDFIYQPHFFKKVIRKSTTEKMRAFVREQLISLNSRALSSDEKTLPDKESRYLYDEYFKNEIEEIESFLDISLESWKK